MTYYYPSSWADAMYLKFVILLNLIVLTYSNPFHKYPYVFLLDVGNEELENTSREQIRLSAPGGSLALRYPAVGNGDILTHVRVSGIDFGTDLKSSILEGGPGYTYVVLIFMGKRGVPFDAVVTVQMLPTSSFEKYYTQKAGEVVINENISTNSLLEQDVDNFDGLESGSKYKYYKNEDLLKDVSSKDNEFAQTVEVDDKTNSKADQSEKDSDFDEYVEVDQGRTLYEQEEYSQSDAQRRNGENGNKIIAYKQFGADQITHPNENKYAIIQRNREEDEENGSEITKIHDKNNYVTVEQLDTIENNFDDSRQYGKEEGNHNRREYDDERERLYRHQNNAELSQSENYSPETGPDNGNSDPRDESYDGESSINEANYNNYALKALLYGYNKVSPEAAVRERNPDNKQDSAEDEISNDEEVHDELGIHDNNNHFDKSDASAVAS